MTKFLKPAPGLLVFDPSTNQHLPMEGRSVEESSYWLRRLRDGDVVETKKEDEKTADAVVKVVSKKQKSED